MLAKIGPGWNSNCLPAVGRFEHDVGADHVGRHQVGRELDALELQVQRVGQRPDQQRLAQAGHAFEQHVAAGDQGGQRAVDDLLVADDHLADLAAQGVEVGAELVELPLHLIRGSRSSARPLRGDRPPSSGWRLATRRESSPRYLERIRPANENLARSEGDDRAIASAENVLTKEFGTTILKIRALEGPLPIELAKSHRPY